MIFQVRVEKDNELAEIARELTQLQSHMLKDQKRLETVIAEKQAVIEAQAAEAERLRKQNKKLQLQLHSLQSKSLRQSSCDSCMTDTSPSSETDSSPKSSFSTKSSSAAAAAANPPQSTKVIEIKSSLPPPPPPLAAAAASKPPVPSRAGVNKKLLKTPPPAPPPPVPARTDTSGLLLERDHHVTITTLNSLASEAKDEGFISEDTTPGDCGTVNNNLPTPMTRNHRSVQKPSEVKQRSQKGALKGGAAATSSRVTPRPPKLGRVIEEHPVTGHCETNSGKVTTVTYWTEPYL